MASEIKVDTISEKTSAGGVTIDSVVHKDSAVYPSSADGGALGSASNEWSDLFLADSSVIKFGADQDTTLTHTDGTGLTLNSTNKLCFNDASQFVQGSSATVLSIGATDEIDLTATAVDLNGTLNVSGVATFQSTPVFPDGSLALADLDIDGGTEIGAAIVDADLFIIDDGAGGANRKCLASRIKTYAGGAALANDGNNRVVTGDGSGGLNGEANLSFDGSTLAVTGAVTVSGTTTFSDDINVIDDKGVIFGTGNDYFLSTTAGEGEVAFYKGGEIGEGTNEGSVTFSVGDSTDSYILLKGGEGGDSALYLYADQVDENADYNRHYGQKDGNGQFFGNYADGVWDDEFRVGDDLVYTEHAISTQAVDYAEFFEWKTELASDARITETYGLTVVLDNDKVRLAEAGEEADVIGVVRPSKTSAVIGGDGIYWNKKRKKNVWGEEEREAYTKVNWHDVNEHGDSIKHYHFDKDRIPQYELIDQPKQDVPNWHLLDSNFKRDDDGNKIPLVVPSTAEEKLARKYTEGTTNRQTGKTLMRRVINPAYDSSLAYVNRADRRKEWCIVGLVGQVPIRDTAIIPTSWKKMKNLESGIDMYFIR